MKFLVFLLILATPTSFLSATDIETSYGAWKLEAIFDGFEESYETTISAEILDAEGGRIGTIEVFNFSEFDFGQDLPGFDRKSAWVRFRILPLSNRWPECDYEFLRYRVDGSEAQYWPKNNSECPIQTMYGMADQFENANELVISVKKRIGYIDLHGFSDAWDAAFGYMNE